MGGPAPVRTPRGTASTPRRGEAPVAGIGLQIWLRDYQHGRRKTIAQYTPPSTVNYPTTRAFTRPKTNTAQAKACPASDEWGTRRRPDADVGHRLVSAASRYWSRGHGRQGRSSGRRFVGPARSRRSPAGSPLAGPSRQGSSPRSGAYVSQARLPARTSAPRDGQLRRLRPGRPECGVNKGTARRPSARCRIWGRPRCPPGPLQVPEPHPGEAETLADHRSSGPPRVSDADAPGEGPSGRDDYTASRIAAGLRRCAGR